MVLNNIMESKEWQQHLYLELNVDALPRENCCNLNRQHDKASGSSWPTYQEFRLCSIFVQHLKQDWLHLIYTVCITVTRNVFRCLQACTLCCTGRTVKITWEKSLQLNNCSITVKEVWGASCWFAAFTLQHKFMTWHYDKQTLWPIIFVVHVKIP